MTVELDAAAVQRAAALTLENLAQLRAKPRPGSPPPVATDDTAAEVPFWGALYGKLMMRATGGLARAIAARLFHISEPTLRQRQEALCLAAGAICGTMLAELRDDKRSCQLENTRIIENIKGYERLFGAPRLTAMVGCDEGTAELRVYFNTIDVASGMPPHGDAG